MKGKEILENEQFLQTIKDISRQNVNEIIRSEGKHLAPVDNRVQKGN